jgi:hypothetical protein
MRGIKMASLEGQTVNRVLLVDDDDARTTDDERLAGKTGFEVVAVRRRHGSSEMYCHRGLLRAYNRLAHAQRG